MVNPSTHLENDEFGYACYTIVIPASTSLAGPMLEIEHAAGQERAKIPAHITVKGTIYGIESLDGLIEGIRNVTNRHAPFVLDVAGKELIGPDDSVILGFPVSTEIQALHDDLVKNIAPLGKPAYRDDPYRVHMSVVNEVKPEGVEIAKKMVGEIDFGEGIQVGAIDLMARDGVAWGGVWKQVERFELASSN
jgi:hypothetical protein